MSRQPKENGWEEGGQLRLAKLAVPFDPILAGRRERGDSVLKVGSTSQVKS
jgi:hypothetical protein